MNIENKKQLATILLAVGLGLVASMLMSKVVNDKIDQQTRAIAKEYQGRSAALVKEIDATKKELNKLSNDYAALSQRIDERPVVRQTAAVEKPQIQKTAFSLRTPPGKRALTMSIDSLSAVGGLVNPGDFVDVIAHLNVPDEAGFEKKDKEIEKVITVLFQNIQVLAVGTNYDPIGAIPPYEAQKNLKTLNVTFAVSPEEAGLLTFAQANGSLQLTLRSPAETQDRVLQQVASWDVLSDFVLERQGTELLVPKKPKIKEEQPEEVEELKPFIQIFRGGKEL
jgi:pilus assembly protein CpaB